MAIINKKNEIDNLELLQGTGEILSDKDKNGKERPWKKHKMENEGLVKLFEKARDIEQTIITQKRLQELKDCGSSLWFLQNLENKIKLFSANFCQVRLCPMCSWRKSLKLFGQVSKIAAELLRLQPSARFIFVTLTVPNCTADELTNTINSMNKAFSYLTSNNRNFAPAKKLKANLLGYMKAMELTYNQQTDTYHPHIHCLLAVRSSYFTKGYIKKSEWQGIWSQAMKADRELIVHVETIKNSTAKAVAEVAKYPVKATDLLKIENEELAVNALLVIHKALRKRRLVTFGCMFAEIKKQLGLVDIENENIDLVHTDEEAEAFEPVRMIFYKWHTKIGAYIC